MKTWTATAIVMVTVGLMIGSTSRAGSIWARGTRRTRELFTDDTARDIGDVLTIVIDEKSKIENTTNRKMEKDTSRTAKITGKLDLEDLASMVPLGRRVFDFPKLDFSSSSNSSFDGAADYDTDRSMSDQITVAVEDVQPNGNLVVLGRRTRTIAGDSQIIEISGVVRPSDIAFDNTVKSTKVADFHLVHRTEGRENRFVRPGWLSRICNILNPF